MNFNNGVVTCRIKQTPGGKEEHTSEVIPPVNDKVHFTFVKGKLEPNMFILAHFYHSSSSARERNTIGKEESSNKSVSTK